MTAQEVIDAAKYGELSNLAVKTNNEAIVTFANLAIREIYKRFQLKTEEFLLELQAGISTYDLPKDCMAVIAAYEEVPAEEVASGTGVRFSEIPVNEANNIKSINTISYNRIQVPLVTAGSYISIIYSARPILIDVNDLTKEIDLPDELIDPLLHYIGYKAHGAVNGDIQAENNTHLTRFKQSCAEVQALGLGVTPDDLEFSDKFYDSGFA